jgi:hypothetical protein
MPKESERSFAISRQKLPRDLSHGARLKTFDFAPTMLLLLGRFLRRLLGLALCLSFCLRHSLTLSVGYSGRANPIGRPGPPAYKAPPHQSKVPHKTAGIIRPHSRKVKKKKPFPVIPQSWGEGEFFSVFFIFFLT